ncbi:MarR family winged helix-turn-helix transcriptional regulator [Yinghuangia sp. YIM S09857]|uniref:MarR family winged helix-turn-helix transcriptional regulator n=1 Tax=Yinghuangia sp. YIM S09857 TaxID=3436929 RepID=UPI003F52926F
MSDTPQPAPSPAPQQAAGPQGREESLEHVHRALESFLAATRSTRLHRELAARAGGNLTRTEAFVLGHIVGYGPLRLSDLAETTGQDRAITSRQVDTLARTGLVERVKDPADGRAHLLRATDTGLTLNRGMRTVWSRWLGESLHEWSDAELEQLATLLGRFGRDIHPLSTHHA